MIQDLFLILSPEPFAHGYFLVFRVVIECFERKTKTFSASPNRQGLQKRLT